MKDSIFKDKTVIADITFRASDKVANNVYEHLNELDGLEDKLSEFEPEADFIAWVLEEALFNIIDTAEVDDLKVYTCIYKGEWTSTQYNTIDFLEKHGVKSKFIITSIEG